MDKGFKALGIHLEKFPKIGKNENFPTQISILVAEIGQTIRKSTSQNTERET
jgi:hypothetical protein